RRGTVAVGWTPPAPGPGARARAPRRRCRPRRTCAGGRRLGDLFGLNHAGNRSAIYVTYADFGRPGFAWRLHDRAAGVSVEVRASDDFRTMVHWSPADRSVISPVIATSLANGFNLRSAGYPSGVRELEPGQTWRGWASVAVALGAS